jgi:hypothetical protein
MLECLRGRAVRNQLTREGGFSLRAVTLPTPHAHFVSPPQIASTPQLSLRQTTSTQRLSSIRKPYFAPGHLCAALSSHAAIYLSAIEPDDMNRPMRDSAGRKVISQRVTLHVVFRSDYAAESLLAARLCLIRDKHE